MTSGASAILLFVHDGANLQAAGYVIYAEERFIDATNSRV